MSPLLNKLIREISLSTGIPKDVVTMIVDSQFLFIREVMALGEKNKPDTFKSVNVTHLGKFATRDYMLKKYKQAYDNRTKDTE
jgi:hypothetical protein